MMLFNPTSENITTEYDKYGENPEKFTLEPGMHDVPERILPLIETILVEKLLWQDPPANKNYDKKREEIKKRIRCEE